MRSAMLAALVALLGACADDAPLLIANARSPAMPPGATVAAVYMDITAREPDALLGAATAHAERAEVHMTVTENGMMQMRPSPRVALPAGETVRFTPGGLHFMLSEVRADHTSGSTFPLRLTFERAGEIEVQVRVHALGEQ